MTKSQEKELKNAQSYVSYKKHYMSDNRLIIECETEYLGMRIPYFLSIGPRGGKKHLQYVNGKFTVS